MAYNCNDGIVGNDGKTYYWDSNTNDFVTLSVETHIPVNQVPADVIVNYINRVSCGARTPLIRPMSPTLNKRC